MSDWLTNDVRWIIEKACSVIADIDIIMGDRGGPQEVNPRGRRKRIGPFR